MKPYAEYADMRAVCGDTLLELAEKDERIVVLEADLMSASGPAPFLKHARRRLILPLKASVLLLSTCTQ